MNKQIRILIFAHENRNLVYNAIAYLNLATINCVDANDFLSVSSTRGEK